MNKLIKNKPRTSGDIIKVTEKTFLSNNLILMQLIYLSKMYEEKKKVASLPICGAHILSDTCIIVQIFIFNLV